MDTQNTNPLLSQTFLVPGALIKLINFVSYDLDEENSAQNIHFSTYPTKGFNAYCSDVNNNKFILKFISNQSDNTAEFLASFFDKKGQALVKSGVVADIKTSISSHPDIKKAVGNWLSENNIDTSDWEKIGQHQQKLVSEQAETMALADKTIKAGSIFRAPLSTNSSQIILFNNERIPVLDSKCILSTLDEKTNEMTPNTSGIYYASQNRHSIPLVLSKAKKDEAFRITLNSEIASKEQVITLLNHSIRTSKVTGGFSLFFAITSEATEELIKIGDLCNSAAKQLSSPTPEKIYEDCINQMIDYISNVEDFTTTLNTLKIYLPINASFRKILFDSESLISSLPKNIANISLSSQWTTNEEKEMLIQDIKSKIYELATNKELKLYCFYGIHAPHNDIESTTYGFIENNINLHSIMPSLLDTVNLINMFKKASSERNSQIIDKKVGFNEDTQEIIF